MFLVKKEYLINLIFMLKLNLNKLGNLKKRLFLVISDLLIIIISISASYSLRLETLISILSIDIRVYLIFFLIFFSVFHINNIYQILLRYFDYFSIKKYLNLSLFIYISPSKFLFLSRFLFSKINIIYSSNNYWYFNNFT